MVKDLERVKLEYAAGEQYRQSMLSTLIPMHAFIVLRTAAESAV